VPKALSFLPCFLFIERAVYLERVKAMGVAELRSVEPGRQIQPLFQPSWSLMRHNEETQCSHFNPATIASIVESIVKKEAKLLWHLQ
jgi:hypothetical protein